ncbi:MAG TPA: hypothetical protein DEP42_07225 [Ruminococcaceae bacterium]|nr:hypothetical protein [Oscillospiraceae bacterium]
MKRIMKFFWPFLVVIVLAVFAVILGHFRHPSLSSIHTEATVYTEGISVRRTADSSSPVVEKLHTNDKINILSSTSKQYKVRYHSATGWIQKCDLFRINTIGIQNARISTIVNTADKQISVPYLFGGITPTGFDCSGLTQYAYAKIGISLPHSSSKQAQMGISIPLNKILPGDLLFFATGKPRAINHVGLYVGNSLFIAANNEGTSICDLQYPYWKNKIICTKRIVS